MSNVSKNPEDLYEAVVRKVLSGEVPGGSRLVERVLAEDLGVSRVPVREILTKLVAQGLLVGGKDRHGAWVRKYSEDEIRQLYFFRGVIEGGIARLLAQKGETKELEAARIYSDQMEALLSRADFSQWAEMDKKFHLCLAQACDNDRLANALSLVLLETHYLFYRHSSSRAVLDDSEKAMSHKKRVLQEHRQLIDFIVNGEAELAEKMIRDVMAESADRICHSIIVSDMENVLH